MSKNNPFAKFVPNPSNIPDPKTISMSDFQKYHSRDMQKMSQNMKVLKRSSRYLGGCFAFLLLVGYGCENILRKNLFGSDNQGGNYLNLKTAHDEHHYAYNRQFQRMNVLGQAKVGDSSQNSQRLLKDLGVNLSVYGSSNIPKKAPHEKYY